MSNKPIVIFGASGKTGREVVNTAQSEGFSCRVIVRKKPTDGFFSHAEVLVCKHQDTKDIYQAVNGVSAVIVVFGPRPPYKDIFCTELTRKIINVMETSGVKRLICQTGAMIGEYPHNRSLLFKLMCSMYKKSNPLGYIDRVQQEEAVIKSSLDWTIVKPCRLKSGEESQIFAGTDVTVGLLSSVSVKNLAKFITMEISSPKFVRKSVFIRNR